MNIFVFDPCPKTSALWLDDIRKNKIITECSQMLSTAINMLVPCHPLPTHKSSYHNHPVTIWMRSSQANFKWAVAYMYQLDKQRGTNLDGSDHACKCLIPMYKKFSDANVFPQKELTPFANCAKNDDVGIDYTYIEDVHEAYRQYIVERWSLDIKPPTWQHGVVPEWRE